MTLMQGLISLGRRKLLSKSKLGRPNFDLLCYQSTNRMITYQVLLQIYI